MSDYKIEELSASTIVAVNKLGLKPGQEQFVSPVSYAAVAAVTPPESAWQRVIIDEDRVVGFIHGNFDENAHADHFKAALWRINVDAEAQGRGVGTFAVKALLEEAKNRGAERLTVIYEPGDAGPESFFLRVGFEPIGETEYGETIGAVNL